MAENRGRPSEQVEKLDQWVLDTEDAIYKYDVNKNPNGCYSVEVKFRAGEKTKPDIDQRMYGKNPVVMVFKTSNRSKTEEMSLKQCQKKSTVTHMVVITLWSMKSIIQVVFTNTYTDYSVSNGKERKISCY